MEKKSMDAKKFDETVFKAETFLTETRKKVESLAKEEGEGEDAAILRVELQGLEDSLTKLKTEGGDLQKTRIRSMSSPGR